MRFSREFALLQVVHEAEIALDSHVNVKRRDLGKITDIRFSFLWILKNIYAVDKDLSRSGRNIAREHIHRSGFSGSVRAKKAEYLAFFDLEADIVYGKLVAVFLGKVFNLYHWILTSF